MGKEATRRRKEMIYREKKMNSTYKNQKEINILFRYYTNKKLYNVTNFNALLDNSCELNVIYIKYVIYKIYLLK
jgi:hypothetical protein